MRMPSDKQANAPVFEIDPTFGEMGPDPIKQRR